MKQVVYVDILVALNMIIGFFLLAAVKRLLRERASAWRVLGGAALGGAYSLAIFLPELPFYIVLPARAAFFALVCASVFGFCSLRRFLRCWAAVAGVNFLFAGAVAGAWFLFRPASLAFKNGAVYFDVGFLPLTLSAAALYALLRLCGRYLAMRNSENAQCSVVIEHLEKSVSAKGIIDTGNTLVDSFTGKKVSVISQQLALSLLPQESAAAVLEPLLSPLPAGARLIPANTVGGSGLMLAFTAKKMKFEVENKSYEVENAALAVSGENEFAHGCSVLLNADIMFGAKTERYGGKKNETELERKAECACAATENQKHRGALHKRSGNSSRAVERSAGAGDNAAHNAGR